MEKSTLSKQQNNHGDDLTQIAVIAIRVSKSGIIEKTTTAMKRLSIILAALLCVVLAAVKVQAGKGDANVVELVGKFYRKYDVAFSKSDNKTSFAKCDSVMNIYCSAEMCKDTKKDRISGIAYDFATDDIGIDSLALQTLNVKYDNGAYTVTYKYNDMNDKRQKFIRNVKLKVGMKDGKISTVKAIEQL